MRVMKWTPLMLKVVASVIASVVLVVSAVWGAKQHFDTSYASVAVVELLSVRLDQKILSDTAKQLQAELWRLRNECGEEARSPKCSHRDRLRWQQIVQELREVRVALSNLRRGA